MSVIFVLIGISLVVAIGFLIAFIWSVKSGQYEDVYTPSVRILFDNHPKKEDIPESKPKSKKKKKWKFKNFITTTKS
ncbi:MAG: cbb3-type cytochrome oxidase assembly protein CcoS [Bacteroidales bacterium]|nr:cbb3-type cytochrome oxidase assembly protein CcoS [Bacteroidales bacterium]RLD33984.1 MAG: cbb3-type cytochrome oxidase assembly protein CcoS [Bacteroidota bacterium]